MKTIYFAGGSFWGLQQFLRNIEGVERTRIGYANSKVASPRYREVCQGRTGAAECVRVDYNPSQVSLESLIAMFFLAIDPTSKNRQGRDVGAQYRSGVYFADPCDEVAVWATVMSLAADYEDPVVVEVMPLRNFYQAEKSLQNYLDRAPGGHCTVSAYAMRHIMQAQQRRRQAC